MANLLLTLKDDGTVFQLDESQVIRATLDPVTPNTGTFIIYSDPFNTGHNRNATVTETSAQVAAQAENLIPLNIRTAPTEGSYSSVYLNGSVNHFGLVTSNVQLGSGSQFEYFQNGNTMQTFFASESPSEIRTLREQEEDEEKSPIAVSKSAIATLTAAEVAAGRLETSGTTYTVTLPTATQLATQLGATAGTSFIWKLNNSASGTITVALGANMTTGTNGSLTVTAANAGEFKFLFRSATDLVISRTV